jgi:hypothetical protein
VAILGSDDLDVRLIDPSSINLSTIAPVHYAIEDVQADGYADLVLQFLDRDVTSLVPGAVDGEVVELKVDGALTDGTLITGTDIITLQVKRGK